MIASRDLYERAAGQCQNADALWHLDAGRMLFIAPLWHNHIHQHGAPIFLAGMHDRFELRVAGGSWQACRCAVIPAGVAHELNVHGNPVAGLYIEPSVDGVHALLPLLAHRQEIDGVVTGSGGEYAPMRELWEGGTDLASTALLLNDLLRFANARAPAHMDPRIAASVATIACSAGAPLPVAAVAASAGLSVSRFQHLFREQVGVAFRRYRAWARMRTAIEAIVAGDNFTAAAHAAGFSDQPHFNHDFRRTFGAPPSVSLARLRE
ncbi:helix-turn-helix transcriptional regulator [Endozoicomonas sp. G2_2]|uniref:helix-turn-helix transcriptional regulator n=1 Tax=Endozoicomonas sp. G2_2 TaxID=2821092 RepID=UPI001ADA613E|nr:helix-turn-helix transcriptional regulator [Endozoicomonas sp. G2_2]MBO9470591.1 helix-turn-helix transcriptional regulator [Endozoicomonas sp. G2_2]